MATWDASKTACAWVNVEQLVDAREVVRARAAVNPAARRRRAWRAAPPRGDVQVIVVDTPPAAFRRWYLRRDVHLLRVAQDLRDDR